MKKIFAVLCLAGSALLFAAPTFSHSTFINSIPKRDAVVKELPSEFRLEFNEDLLTVGEDDPNKLVVTDAKGEVVSGESEVAGPFIFAPNITTESKSGSYEVTYRVVSADGHVVEGSFKFALQEQDAQHHKEKVVDEVKEPQQHETHDSFIHVHADHIIMALIALSAIAMWFLIARSRRDS